MRNLNLSILSDLWEKHFSVTIEYRNLDSNVLGCTVFDHLGRVVKVIIGDTEEESVSYERRIRSTIAHEAGHCLMHAFLFVEDETQSQFFDGNIDRKKRRILCRKTDIKPVNSRANGYNGQWWEWQANRAIGGLLLPEPMVRLALNNFLERGEITGSETLPEENRDHAALNLAKQFEVNPVVASIRIKELFPEKKQLTF